MLKKGNVYTYKNKLWIFVGRTFSGYSKDIKTDNFVQYTFIPANKNKLTGRDIQHFKRDIYKYMKHEPTASVLYGKIITDEQLLDISKQHLSVFEIMYVKCPPIKWLDIDTVITIHKQKDIK